MNLPPDLGGVQPVDLGDFLYYPSDSFVASQREYLVLALPVGGPWFNMTEAVDLAKAMPTKYIVPIHNIHLSETNKVTTDL